MIFTVFSVHAQDSVLLIKYIPTKQGQYKSTCASYATVYTALSAAHNLKNGVNQENDPAFKTFSYGFVASKIKSEKTGPGRLFNQCGAYVTADLALQTLKDDGTVDMSVFRKPCKASAVSKFTQQAKTYRIKSYIVYDKDSSDEAAFILRLKNLLKQNQPIVIALLQESFFHDAERRQEEKEHYVIRFPEDYKQAPNDANHVICIVGFNDSVSTGSFIIKNNYLGWGAKGFAYVRYNDLYKLIRMAYTITL